MPSPEDQQRPLSSRQPSYEADAERDETIDVHGIILRLRSAFPAILGLGLLGLAAAVIICLAYSPFALVSTTARVVFSFDGYDLGQYPDKSKFSADDLRAPEVIAAAVKRQKLDASQEFQTDIRAAITVEGIIPPNVIKERDRLRAAGQAPAIYRPDEYTLILTLPRKFPLSLSQREQLLLDIVDAYRERFQRTYANLPVRFGNAFVTLNESDFFEYELIINQELEGITDYLTEQLESAKTFRSPTTNLSFGDLLEQTHLFSQIRANETLGFIRQNGVADNRKTAMVRMDYYLQTLGDEEHRAQEEATVVQDLLNKTQERAQSYVLGTRTPAVESRPDAPVLDQGLIDSLLSNDAYNFLVRKALDAGLKVKRLESEKSILLERKKSIEAMADNSASDQVIMTAEIEKSLAKLQIAYKTLIDNIRKTSEDYERQRFADAVWMSMQPRTEGLYKRLALAGAAGGIVGLMAGAGLALLGLFAKKGKLEMHAK